METIKIKRPTYTIYDGRGRQIGSIRSKGASKIVKRIKL